MPVDPEISLAGTPPPQSSMQPFGLMENFANVQNALNQNRLFQQTFQARQLAGQIMATSPDEETGLRRILQSPAAPFVGDFINQVRSSRLAILQASGESQKQASDGLTSVLKYALPAAMADPTQWDSAVSAGLSTLSPVALERDIPAINSLRDGLVGGLPKDPQQARTVFNQRLGGLMQAVGLGPDAIHAIMGTPTSVQAGSGTYFGTQLPAQLGGGFQASSMVPMGVAPVFDTIKSPFGASIPVLKTQNGILLPDSQGRFGGEPTQLPISPDGSPVPRQATNGVPAAMNSQVGGASNALGSPNPFIGPTTTQEQAYMTSGKVAGDVQDLLSNESRELPMALKRINMMVDALGQFQAGGGTDLRADVAKFLQALKGVGFKGISDQTIEDVAHGSLAAQQVFTGEVRPLVIAELKAAAQGTGRVMLPEVNAFLQMMDSDKDPRALMIMLNQAQWVGQMEYDRASKLPEFREGIESGAIKHYQPQDYFIWYNDQYGGENKLPTASKSGGLNLGPYPISRALGASPDAEGPKKVRNWTPKGGLTP